MIRGSYYKEKSVKQLIWRVIASGILWSTIIQCSYTPVANIPGTTVWQIMDKIQGLTTGNNTITQDSLPVTLSAPGVYALAQDLTLTTTEVITIASDNVVLDLKGHLVTGLGSLAAITIMGDGVVVRNGAFTATGNTVTFINSASNNSAVTIENIDFYATSGLTGITGISIGNSSINTIIRDCNFQSCSPGISFLPNGSQAMILGCNFNNCGSAALSLNTVSTCILKDLHIQFGGSGIVLQSTGYINIEDVVVSTVGTTTADAAVMINGAAHTTLQRVSIDGTTSVGGGIPGIAVTNSSSTIIDQCFVNNASGGGILLGPSTVNSTLIRHCVVSGCAGIGVDFLATSTTDHVYNTVSTSNAGGDFFGVPAVLIATSDTAISTAPYWVNAGY